MEKPDVDLIEGLSPAISIEQKATSHNPRSTVGTVTEIHDYLRLLFARVGDPYCPDHDITLQAQSVSQMVDHVLQLPEDTRLMILAPLIVGRKGEQHELFEDLRAQGFVRLRIDGEVHDIDNLPKLAKTKKHTIEVVIDRVKGASGRRSSDWPNPSRPRCATPTDAPWRWRSTAARSICSPRASPARSAATRCRSWSRGCSRSTTRWARARAATAWAASASSTRSAWLHSRIWRWARAQSKAGIGAISSTSRCCRAWPLHYGFDLETPFEKLPEAYAGRGAERLRPREDPLHLRRRARPEAHTASTHSRASSPTWSGATRRPIRRWCARSWPSISTAHLAPSARARGCGAKRVTCSWAGRPSTASVACR